MNHKPAPTKRSRIIRIFFPLLTVISALALIIKIAIAFLISGTLNTKASSIGIIGGADGPTSIFVTANITGRGFFEWIFWIILLIIGIAGLLYCKRKEK